MSVDDGTTVTASEFDALGRMTQTGTTIYTYDSFDRVTTEDATAFSYAGFEIDPVRIGTLSIARSPAGLPMASRQGTDTPVLLGRNAHGDIGYQHDAAGVVTATRSYTPLGDIAGSTGTNGPLGFQGDYTNTTGDVWMGARWYRPGIGGFTTRDTVFGSPDTPISLNRYTYAWGTPLNMWDPDGRDPETFAHLDFEGADCSEFAGDLAAACETAHSGGGSGQRDSYDPCDGGGRAESNDDLLLLAGAISGGASSCIGQNLDAIVSNPYYQFSEAVVYSPFRAVHGTATAVANPLDTAKAIKHAAEHPWQTATAMWEQCTGSARGAGECTGDALLAVATGSGWKALARPDVTPPNPRRLTPEPPSRHAVPDIETPAAPPSVLATGTSRTPPLRGVATEAASVPMRLWDDAPYDGFLLNYRRAETLQPGTRIDRFGAETGRFFSPEGTPLPQRALPNAPVGPPSVYEVLKPLDVEAGVVAPAFGQPGLGIQYRSSLTTADLIPRRLLEAGGVMTRDDLVEILREAQVDPSYYSLGGEVHESLCLTVERGEWHVFLSDAR